MVSSELQVLTKDGRHIFGKELTAAEVALALTNVNDLNWSNLFETVSKYAANGSKGAG